MGIFGYLEFQNVLTDKKGRFFFRVIVSSLPMKSYMNTNKKRKNSYFGAPNKKRKTHDADVVILLPETEIPDVIMQIDGPGGSFELVPVEVITLIMSQINMFEGFGCVS
jgi:hypothetical protein